MVADIVSMFFAAFLYLPIYYDLGVTSVYAYLDIRFGYVSRKVTTALFLLQSILYNGIVIYSPALALAEVSGLDIIASILVVGGVCISYTALGGIKAVIWTDVWQSMWMFSGFIGILVIAAVQFDGFSEIADIAKEGNRLFTDQEDLFNPDPRIRHTFWSIMVGNLTGASLASWCCRQDKVESPLC